MVVGTSDPREEDFERFEREPMSFGEGRYLFAPPNRLYDHALTLQELLRVRVRKGPKTVVMPIGSFRQLTDGEATLGDTVHFTDEEDDYLHTLALMSGTEPFFSSLSFPLELGDPSPPSPDLGTVLGGWLNSEGSWKLGSVERDVEYRGRHLVKLTFTRDGKVGERLMYWIDLERGAIPMRTREAASDGSIFFRHIERGDVRWVGGRGWMPFWERDYAYNPEPLESRRPKGIRFVEKLIIRADFDRVPARSEFRLELNEPRGVIHAETLVSYGKRDVWDLDSIAPSAARGHKRFTADEPPVGAPVLPGERGPGPWWAVPLLVLGMLCLAAGGWTGYRRMRRA
jgi:hypothetical protein